MDVVYCRKIELSTEFVDDCTRLLFEEKIQKKEEIVKEKELMVVQYFFKNFQMNYLYSKIKL